MKFIFIIISFFAFSLTAAEARTHKHHRHRPHHHRVHHSRPHSISGGFLLPHPAGCPSRNFCACGASIRVFGRNIRSLWLAAAWYRFPRSAPHEGTVAVRRGGHHVVVLEHQIAGSDWLVSDYNSGGHLSRRHVRNIAGWTIVNPRANSLALR